MLKRPSYEMSVTAMAPSQFEFETPDLHLQVKEQNNSRLNFLKSQTQTYIGFL